MNQYAADQKAPRVLVVEDDPDTLLYLTTILQRNGLPVVGVDHPRAALSEVSASRFDVVLSDVELPGFSGVQLVEELHRLQPGLPVALITAHPTLDRAVGALRSNAAEFLTKPVQPSDVVETVFRLAARSAAEHPRRVVLAVGAHPDDVEIGVGGTLAMHRLAGDEVVVLTLSRGARGGDSGRRAEESQRAADLIGARLILADLEDTRISVSDPTVGIIEEVLKETGAHVVYTHSGNDLHQDHRAVHQASKVAARRVETVACYQSPSATVDYRPNRFVDIEPAGQTKLDLISCFSSQAARPYLEADVLLANARYWSRFGGGRLVEPLEVLHDRTPTARSGQLQTMTVPTLPLPISLPTKELHHV